MKIGMIGGTFNPVHLGHLVLAQEAWHRFSLDKVVFIPAYVSPHKVGKEDASAADRMEMVSLSLKGDDRFEVSHYEIDKEGISYSIETIKHFKDKYGRDTELFFLTGSDSMEGLSTWKEIDHIFSLTTFVIATRPGWDTKSPYAEKAACIDIPHIDVSSTMIRDRVKNKKPIEYLVSPSVARYIRDHGLYK